MMGHFEPEKYRIQSEYGPCNHDYNSEIASVQSYGVCLIDSRHPAVPLAWSLKFMVTCKDSMLLILLHDDAIPKE